MSKNRKSRLDSAADVLQRLFKNRKSPLGQQFQRWNLCSDWGNVIGPEWSQYCRPVAYLRGRLYLWVDSAARMQEMHFVLEPIREAINKHVGYRWVRQIQMTSDPGSIPVAAYEKWKELEPTFFENSKKY